MSGPLVARHADLKAAAVMGYDFASKEEYPALWNVRVQSREGALVFSATDRYKAGWFAVNCARATVDGLDLLVDARALRRAMGIIRTRAGSEIEITTSANSLNFNFKTDGLQVNIHTSDGLDYPDLGKIVSALGQGGRESVTLAPDHLAAFTRVGGPGHLDIELRKSGPITISKGKHFWGAIVPVKAEKTWLDRAPQWVVEAVKVSR